MLISSAENCSRGGIAQLVERLVRNERLTNTLIFSQVLSPDFSEVKPRREDGEAARAAREFLRKHDLLPKPHGDLQLELGSITAGAAEA